MSDDQSNLDDNVNVFEPPTYGPTAVSRPEPLSGSALADAVGTPPELTLRDDLPPPAEPQHMELDPSNPEQFQEQLLDMFNLMPAETEPAVTDVGGGTFDFGYGETSDGHTTTGFAGLVDASGDGHSATILGGHVKVGETGVHVDVEVSSQGYVGPSGGVQAGVGTASADAHAGEGVYGAGAGASAVEGNVHLGNPGGDPTSDGDAWVHGGLSIGLAAGGRVYAGTDADHDGEAEYGFGVDAGPVSFDIRVENPLAPIKLPDPDADTMPVFDVPVVEETEISSSSVAYESPPPDELD